MKGDQNQELKIENQGANVVFMTNIKIISWNVRKANNREKRTLIKALVKTHKADLICVQETKLKGVSSSLVISLGAGRLMDCVASNAQGASRGVLVLWDSRILQLLVAEES